VKLSFVVLILSLAAAFCAPAGAGGREGKIDFFYFDPDTRLHDFELLKTRFEESLPPSYSFQPFLRANDLIGEVTGREVRFLILAADRTGALAPNRTAIPLLFPESNGRTAYRKRFLSRGDGGAIHTAAGTRRISLGEGSDSWSWVIVSKDLDALLAVALGQVDAAVVDPESISLLRSINPDALARLTVGDDTEEMMNAPLCFIRELASPAEVSDVKERFLEMDDRKEGRDLLLLLGYDRWTVPPGGGLLASDGDSR